MEDPRPKWRAKLLNYFLLVLSSIGFSTKNSTYSNKLITCRVQFIKCDLTIPTAKEIQNNDSRWLNHPSNNIRKSKLGKNEIKENVRTANKKNNTTAYTRITVPDNEISISGVAPQDGQTQKIKIIGEPRTLEPIDDPT